MADTKPEDFFLPAAETGDDLKFLTPSRQGNKIEPLIDGAAFFTAVEEAMAAAKESIYCAIWSMYPTTPLLSSKVKSSLKVKDWQGLMIKMAKENKVRVRIITSDFDPVLDNPHHQRAWKGFNGFVAQAVKAGLTKDQFQMFCSLHPAEFSPGFAEKLLKKQLKEVIDKLNKAKLAGLENSPGIWPLVKLASGKLKMADKPALKIVPGTHHQKALVIDGKIGFVGGINISPFYHTTPEHKGNQRAHDIFCRVEGPVVEDIERNFVGRWNAEPPRFTAFVTAANAFKLKGFKIANPFPISTLAMSKTALGKAGNAVAQLHRTQSSSITGGFPLLTLKTDRGDVKQSYEKVISLANEYIYIENQYVRVVELADWIAKRFKANSKLQVIIVVPILPEELEEGKADELTLHGLFLQHKALTTLRTALGRNLGLYSLVQNKKAPTDSKNKKLSSFGSMRVYPHSKVLIVDDVFASIGSANVNPRGFLLDSEANIGWHDPMSVKAFREQLWREHLGSSTGSVFASWKPADYVKEWDAIAKKNTTATPGARQGFIVPHDPDLAKGTQQPFNDFLVQVESQDQQDPETRTA